MIARLSKQRAGQIRILVGILFLVATCLALLVKASRSGSEGLLVNSVLWNALPSYCFVFGLCLVGILYKPHLGKIPYRKFCMSVTAGAILYEVEQIWTESRTFDPYDLTAIVLGGLSAWLVYGMIRSKKEI